MRRSLLILIAVTAAACGKDKVEPVRDAGPLLPNARCVDGDGDGIKGTGDCVGETAIDCNDNDPLAFPGSTEICNGQDDTCDGRIDEGLPIASYYKDVDGDGVGSSIKLGEGCRAPPTGTVTTTGDCNDNDTRIRPGVAETCNAIDDDCDGAIDNGLPFQDFYVDQDGDGFGDPMSTPMSACQSTVVGRAPNRADCNDATPIIKPGQAELCNRVDDNCDGQVDNGISFLAYYTDADGDGFGAAGTMSESSCAPVAGKVTNASDCDDTIPSVKPGATEQCNSRDDNCDGRVDENLAFSAYYPDMDGDGAGQLGSTAVMSCNAIAGKVTNATDCNDADPTVKPGAAERCNNVDDNCNMMVDEGLTTVAYFADLDADGFGAGASQLSCTPIAGKVTNSTDCDDMSAARKPGAPEVCNNIDDNCNNQTDEGLTLRSFYTDGDGDGFGAGTATPSCLSSILGKVTNATDCDDTRAGVHPGAAEICNAADDNCNMQADEGLALTSYYPDVDNDGHGQLGGAATQSCGPIVGKVANNDDCDDTRNTRYPGATEQCNGLDDNCNNQIDDGAMGAVNYYRDADGDTFGQAGSVPQLSCSAVSGWVTNSLDCNDGNAGIKPTAAEVCNGVDDNCSGAADEGLTMLDYWADGDMDGYGAGLPLRACQAVMGRVTNNTDCDDTRPGVHPNVTEVCNGIDDNCVSGIDEGLNATAYYLDQDMDTFGAGTALLACSAVPGRVTNNTDCNDNNPAVKPGATELCNGVDDNCVGGIDEGLTVNTYYRDQDGDLFGAGAAVTACIQPMGHVTASGDCNDNNAAVKPGAMEQCNGVDDNCVGGIDEGFAGLGTSCSAGVGACLRTGQNVCNAQGTAVVCNTSAGTPTTELCNNVDDNCNGMTDEGFGLGASCSGGLGVCARTGTTVCAVDGGARCNATPGAPTAAACDGLDNDCDGIVDEPVLKDTVIASATAFSDIEMTPLYFTPSTTPGGCKGGIIGTGTDVLIGGAMVMGGPTQPLVFQALNDAGVPTGAPVQVTSLSYSEISVAQAGIGYLVAGIYASTPSEIDLYFLDQAGNRLAYMFTAFKGSGTVPATLDSLHVVRTGGKRVTLVWREVGTGIKLGRVEPCTPDGTTWEVDAPSCNTLTTSNGTTLLTNGTNVTIQPGLGVDTTISDWVGTQTCTAPGNSRVGIAYIASTGSPISVNDVRFFTVSESGLTPTMEQVVYSGAAPRTFKEPDLAYFKDGVNDAWALAYVTSNGSTTAPNTDFYWWLSPGDAWGYPWFAVASQNGQDSIRRPRVSVTATNIWWSAERFVADASTFKQQLMTRVTDLTGTKLPTGTDVEISPASGACVGDADCRPGNKISLASWAPFSRLYYSAAGSSPSGSYGSRLTCN